MTGLPRPVLSLLALSLLSLASTAQVQDTFNEGVTQLAQGNNEAALALFQQVLAEDPSHEDAYELWQSTSHDIWMKKGFFSLALFSMKSAARRAIPKMSTGFGSVNL